MNIIICGAGKVGFSISKQLSAQGHSVTVIDQSTEDIKKINDTQDVKGIVGRASLPTVLDSAGADKADMIIAVTRNDETNMIVCQLASSLFNVSKKIARIRTKDFLEGKWGKLYNKSNIPIDVIISPELEVAKSLYRRLEAPGASSLLYKDLATSISGEIITSIGILDLLNNLPHFPSKKSFVLIRAIFFETLNSELANWQTIILVSSFLVTAITISAFSAPAFSKTVGREALPTTPFTSWVSLIFLISSED